jgi:hypothetical protein
MSGLPTPVSAPDEGARVEKRKLTHLVMVNVRRTAECTNNGFYCGWNESALRNARYQLFLPPLSNAAFTTPSAESASSWPLAAIASNSRAASS